MKGLFYLGTARDDDARVMQLGVCKWPAAIKSTVQPAFFTRLNSGIISVRSRFKCKYLGGKGLSEMAALRLVKMALQRYVS